MSTILPVALMSSEAEMGQGLNDHRLAMNAFLAWILVVVIYESSGINNSISKCPTTVQRHSSLACLQSVCSCSHSSLACLQSVC